MTTPRMLLGLLIALAAGLRFYALDQQSFALDETFTVRVLDRPFVDMLGMAARTEPTPPTYYVIAWIWQQVFGNGEAGLRSLSALIGVATVPTTDDLRVPPVHGAVGEALGAYARGLQGVLDPAADHSLVV